MKLGILLFTIGAVLLVYLLNIKFKRKVLSKIGVVLGVLFLLYGVILLIQPDEYIVYTKTTIK